MKCRIMLHFIWVFTFCQRTRLGVSTIQRVKYYGRAYESRNPRSRRAVVDKPLDLKTRGRRSPVCWMRLYVVPSPYDLICWLDVQYKHNTKQQLEILVTSFYVKLFTKYFNLRAKIISGLNSYYDLQFTCKRILNVSNVSLIYEIPFQVTKPGHGVLVWKIFLQIKWLIPTAGLALGQSQKLSRPLSWE